MRNPAQPTLLWFRNDLRLMDNPALAWAVEQGGAVIPVFIWSPEDEAPWSPGAASRWWLHQSLRALDSALRGRGLRLVLRSGRVLPALKELIAETGAVAVAWNRRYEPGMTAREVLSAADVKLGATYPRPIVDRALARRRALTAFAQITRRRVGGER